jgi:cytochrome c oxidase subunit I+III
MKDRAVLDVSHLPTVAFGSRAPIWWGVAGLMAIEGTMFAIVAASYLYLRGGARIWPPSGAAHPGLWLTTLNLAVLLASIVPMHLTNKAAMREDLPGIRRWLTVTTVLSVLFLVGQVATFDRLTYRWDSHAYGSLVWTTGGLHTLHVLTGTLENLLFLAILIRGPFEDKHLVDIRVNGMYWFFVALSWIPFYALFFLDPGLLGV